MGSSVIGGANVIRALRRIGSGAQRDAIAITKKHTTNIENDAKANAAVDTGNMRRMITQKFDASNIEGSVISGSDYGIFVELGTRRSPAQPYMRPAHKKFIVSYKEELTRLIIRGRRGI